MPLDLYREQVEGGTPAKEEADSEAVAAGPEHWLDPDSSWDATRERPLPEFDWGDD